MSNHQNDALEELMNLPVDERLEAIAKDLARKRPRFSKISAHDLAEALDVPDHLQPSGDWSFTRYAEIVSVEEYAEFRSPASEIVYLIRDNVSESRFEELLELSAPLDDDPEPRFDFLTRTERSRLEQTIAEDQLEANSSNGMNCIAHFSVQSSSGQDLRFEATVEDDGCCIELRSPYDCKNGRFVNLDKCITDSW
jgi:hypothetical protein